MPKMGKVTLGKGVGPAGGQIGLTLSNPGMAKQPEQLLAQRVGRVARRKYPTNAH